MNKEKLSLEEQRINEEIIKQLSANDSPLSFEEVCAKYKAIPIQDFFNELRDMVTNDKRHK